MNEKRDIVFDKARNLFHNRIKRTWIDLHPHLENSTKRAYKPEVVQTSSKFVEPQQSIVSCESYVEDKPLLWQELGTENFWDHLYSDKWGGGICLRIFEGELLDALLLALHQLEEKGELVSHTSYTFAHNTRFKQLHEKLKETMFIKFIYYGTTTCSEAMLHDPESRERHSGMVHEPVKICPTICVPEFDSDHLEAETVNAPKSSVSVAGSRLDIKREKSMRTSSIIAPGQKCQSVDRRNSIAFRESFRNFFGANLDEIELDPSEVVKHLQELKLQGVVSVPDATEAMLLKKMKTNCYSVFPVEYDVPLFESYYIPRRNIILDKKSYAVVADSSTEVTSSTSSKTINLETGGSKEDEKYYHFYLNGLSEGCITDKRLSLEQLRQKKVELQCRREEHKSLTEKAKNLCQKLKFPPLVQELVHVPIKHFDKAPTFEEFVKIIAEDNKIDPRYSKSKQMTEKMVKKYNLRSPIFKTTRKKKEQLIIVNVPIIKEPNECDTLHKANRNIKAATQRQAGNETLKSSLTKDARLQRNRERFANGVVGVTDCKPFRNQILREGTQFRQQRRGTIADPMNTLIEYRATIQRTTSTVSVSDEEQEVLVVVPVTGPPANAVKEITRQPKKEKADKSPSLKKYITGDIEDTASWLQDDYSDNMGEAVSPEKRIADDFGDMTEESDGENEVTRTTEAEADINAKSKCFDTDRLNQNYSIEKLRKRRGPTRKKPAFYAILKKFFQKQQIVNMFATNSGKKGKSPMDLFRMSIGAGMQNVPPKSLSPRFTVGRVRRFAFLDGKAKRTPDLDITMPDFDVKTFQDFLDKLISSFNDFVIRKELISTNIDYETISCITFTRKSTSFGERL